MMTRGQEAGGGGVGGLFKERGWWWWNLREGGREDIGIELRWRIRFNVWMKMKGEKYVSSTLPTKQKHRVKEQIRGG